MERMTSGNTVANAFTLQAATVLAFQSSMRSPYLDTSFFLTPMRRPCQSEGPEGGRGTIRIEKPKQVDGTRPRSERFLEDGRLPLHNNFSEQQLRREALGRKNWLFVGSDDGGQINATFVTLIASCQLHGIEPFRYLRDLFCLLPSWPNKRALELAPAYWAETASREEVKQKLDGNIWRRLSLGLDLPERITTKSL
ncbi:MAG: hypothetical protein D6806_03250 [Deltaproteobacteria bacterium]|nr:MAG: hypothetical protein D6806_03250 [Deltaproteobacteria bacterium]